MASHWPTKAGSLVLLLTILKQTDIASTYLAHPNEAGGGVINLWRCTSRREGAALAVACALRAAWPCCCSKSVPFGRPRSCP